MSRWSTHGSIPCWAAAIAAGCLVEANPDFYGEPPRPVGSGSATSGEAPTSTSGGSASEPTSSTTNDSTGGDGSSSSGEDPCAEPDACEEIHIGPSATACPRPGPDGEIRACDFHGAYSLRVAAAAARLAAGGTIVLHDDAGGPFRWVGAVDVYGNTRIEPAADTPAQNLVIVCDTVADANLRLLEDDSRISGVTLVTRDGCRSAIDVRTDSMVPGTETGGHVFEGLTIVAHRPEFMGSNASAQPLASLGPNSVLRNSYFRGYHEGRIDLQFADGTTINGNTFAHFQAYGASVLDVGDASDVVIANNVFLALSRTSPQVVAGSDATTNLTLVGNIAEGFDAFVTGLDPADHTVDDNVLGPLEVEAPGRPRFLADATQRASTRVPMEGVSADGVDLSTLPDPFPGALQQPSERTLPRPAVVRVGEGLCGVDTCDFTHSDEDEIQRAVWHAWPGGTVEIYPSSTPYAGSAVVSWPVSIVGMGVGADEVALVTGEEDTELAGDGLWAPHPAVVAVTRQLSAPVAIEGLTIRAPAGRAAILIESSESGQAPPGEHVLRRLWIEDDGSGVVDSGLYLGDATVLQDVLIRGDVSTCIRYGVRSSEEEPTPATTSAVTHLTCRLQTAAVDVAAFDVASVTDATFVNMVVEMETPGPLLRAQRRSEGDAGPTALDVPISFTLDVVSVRGSTADLFDFAMGDGTYAVTTDVVPVGPLFVSGTDSHLDPLAPPIDAGMDPSFFSALLIAGVDIDGTDRSGRTLDRGAYEEGG